MIASSSTFRPQPGRIIRNLFRLLHATEALVYSSHPWEAAAFSYLTIIFGRIASGVPWFLCLTLCLSRGMNGDTLDIFIITLGTIWPEDSEAGRNA